MDKIIPNEYKITLPVASYDVGADGRMRLSSLLRYQQEAGEQHLALGNLAWQNLYARGMAFVTSRWHVVLHRLPRMGETVSLTTWHRNRKGPRFFRCYEWRDEAGALLVEGVMQFALVSVKEHRLLRGDEFMACAPLPDAERTVACGDPARFSVGGTVPTGTYTVRWSDLDFNGHLNNTHYGDLLCDFAPGGMAGRVPREVQLHFAGECRLGDTLSLSAATGADGDVVVGDTARGRTFAAQITWGEG